MTNFIVDPSHISQEEILADLNLFIQSKPDAAAWRDYFAGGAGTTVTELIAGMGSFLAFQTIVARREAFLRYAQNRSSLIGHAQNRGYSIYRGLNPRIEITMIPTVTTTLTKHTDIGSVKDTDLILLDDVMLVAGTPVTFVCTIGTVRTEEIVYTGNSGPAYMRFKQPLVSEDCIVKLNGSEVNVSKRLVDAETGSYVFQSNAVGSVDVFYLNSPAYPLITTGDVISIEYVTYNALQFVASDVKVDYDGVQLAVITQRIVAPETNIAIATNAPLYAETQYVVRAREDYLKILRLLNPSIIETGFSDISPMVVAMHYIKNDLVLLTADEKEVLINAVISARNLGLAPPEFVEPTRVPLTLICNAKFVTLTAGLDVAIKSICSNEGKLFARAMDFDHLENQVEDLPGIKVARFEVGTIPWTANMTVQHGQHVNIGNGSNFVYRASEIQYRSAAVEPVWPTVVGDKVTDGRVVWECKYFERQCDPFNPSLPLIPPRATWAANTNYKKDQIVIPTVLGIFEYVAVETLNKSGAIEPVWPERNGATTESMIGKTKQDQDILWQAVPTIGTPTVWVPNKIYRKGDAVIATNQTASDTVGVMFQAIGYLGTAGATSPVFPLTEFSSVADGNVVWYTVNKTSAPSKLRRHEFYVIEAEVNLVNGTSVL